VTWTGNVSPVMRQKSKGTRPLRNKMRMLARRAVLPGYPVNALPMNPQEALAYLSGDKLVCLRCGQKKKSLGVHLMRMHGMDLDQYKKMYGLPMSRGVVCASTREIRSEQMSSRIDDEFREKAKHMGLARQGKKYKLKGSSYAAKKLHERSYAAKADENVHTYFDILMARVRQGEYPKNIMKSDGMPGSTWFNGYFNQHFDKSAEFQSLMNSMPYEWQVKATMKIGSRIDDDIRVLRAKGMSDHTIAARLGVTSMAVWYRRKKAGIE